MEFHLDANCIWNYKALIEHLRTSVEMGESFSSLEGDFYSQSQFNKETEDQFADELQILSTKVLSICLEWKAEVNEALKLILPSDCITNTLQLWHIIFLRHKAKK